MELTEKEKKLLKRIESSDSGSIPHRVLFSVTKYTAFVFIMILVCAVLFQDMIGRYPLAFALIIFALTIYEMKGREILYYRIIKDLQAKVKQ